MKFDIIAQTINFCKFLGFYSIFSLGRTKNEVHICNLHAKTQFLMYDKRGCQQKNFQIQKGDGGQSGSQDFMKTVDLSWKLIFTVSVTQKEKLSGVFISDFEKSAFWETLLTQLQLGSNLTYFTQVKGFYLPLPPN